MSTEPKDFSATLVGARHVASGAAGGAVKGAVVTAGIGAAALAVGTFFTGGLLPLGLLGASALGFSVGGAALSVVGAGAAVGGALGGAGALASVGETIRDERQQAIENEDRAENRAMNNRAMAQREALIAAQTGQSVSPDGLPRGMGAAVGRG